MQVSLNGNLVEDIDNCHRYSNMEIYAGADKAWYQAAGSYAGFWKFNPDLATGAPVANPTIPQQQAYNPGYGDVSGVIPPAAARTISSGTGEDRLVPLSIMSGFFKTRQYIPLNLLGELVISFTLASSTEAVFQVPGATNGDYSLSDIFLECDVVQPHFMLQELMNKVANSEGENGIVIPYEAPIISAGQTLSSGSNLSVIVSRATNNLRRLLYAHQLTTGNSSINFPSVSTFGYNATTSWQVRIGSLYFPSQPATTAARMFGLLQTAYGEAVNDKPGLANRNIYEETTSLTGTTTKVTSGRNRYADMFIVGYNFDSYKNTSATQVLDADGVSVLGQAGSQVVVQVSQTGSVTPVVALIATRYLSLMNGSLKIVGVWVPV